MAGLKEVKNRIASVVATQQITKAMKMVAAAKLRKLQGRILQMRPFAQKLSQVFNSVAGTQDDRQDWYNEARPEEHILLVVISSDRGLCGSFNNHLYKAVIKHLRENYNDQYARQQLTLLPLGKKGYEYFSKRPYKLESKYMDTVHRLSFERASAVAEFIAKGFREKTYDKVEIFYNSFKNIATQVLTRELFLPLAPTPEYTDGSALDMHIYQPNHVEVLTTLAPRLLNIQLFKALLDSGAAENGARMTAMDKATENAGELLKELRLEYNRTRQAAITKEILEIVGGAEALKGA